MRVQRSSWGARHEAGGSNASSSSRLSAAFPKPKFRSTRASSNGRLTTLRDGAAARLSFMEGYLRDSFRAATPPATRSSSGGGRADAGALDAPAAGSWVSQRVELSASLKHRLNRLVIHPNSPWKSGWDLFILFCVLYSSVVTPFLVAFDTTFFAEVDTTLNLIFLVDIFVQGCTGYFILGGSRFPVLQIDRAFKNYARSWFAPDVLAAIPFDSIVPKLRAVALVKTIRLVKVRRILKKYNEMSIGPFLKVFSILFFWVLCAHWMACRSLLQSAAHCECTREVGRDHVHAVEDGIRGGCRALPRSVCAGV